MEQKNTNTDQSQQPHKAEERIAPIEKGEVYLREHSFDGIQEYDQRMPNWWLTIFWISILVFFIYYLAYYTLGVLPDTRETMDARVEAIHQKRADALQKVLDSLDDETLVNKLSVDSEFIAAGKAVYLNRCVACHGTDLKSNGGATARPLQDGTWHYGNKPMDIFNLILKGTPAESKGYKMMRMPEWETQIGAKKVAQVTAYLISMNPKDFAEFKKE